MLLASLSTATPLSSSTLTPNPTVYTMQLQQLAGLLAHSSAVSTVLSFDDLIKLCDVVAWLRDDIALVQPSYVDSAPPSLPVNIHDFLKNIFTMTDEGAKVVWHALRDVAWEEAFSSEE